MHRFFIDRDNCIEDVAVLENEDVAHAARVLRLKVGDEIELCDGEGNQCSAVLISIDSKNASAKCSEWHGINSEAKCRITLYQSQPKAGKIETILQKGTEIGIASFGIFNSERSVVRDAKPKAERLERVIREAARQSGRGRIPNLRFIDGKSSGKIGHSEDLCKQLSKHQAIMLAYEAEEKRDTKMGLKEIFTSSGAALTDLALIIGPEGGFSEDEAQAFCDAGALPVSLGRRILRTETAGPAFAAIVLFALGDMSI